MPLQAGMYLTEAYKLRPQMDRPNNHKLDNQGWLGRAAAAVELRYTERINFEQCRFEHLGGSGLDYVKACRGGTTDNCTFTDIAMNGYVCGSFSPEGLETHLPYQPGDFREVCTGQVVTNWLCQWHQHSAQHHTRHLLYGHLAGMGLEPRPGMHEGQQGAR